MLWGASPVVSSVELGGLVPVAFEFDEARLAGSFSGELASHATKRGRRMHATGQAPKKWFVFEITKRA